MKTAHAIVRRCVLGSFVAAGLLAGGCRSSGPVEITDGAAYPALKQIQVFDIHVLRADTKIAMTNTSSHAFGPCRMWLNQWYSRELPGFGVGESMTLELDSFKDRYGTAFRAGGFWAIENPEKLVLAQIEEAQTLVGLVVIGEKQ